MLFDDEDALIAAGDLPCMRAFVHCAAFRDTHTRQARRACFTLRRQHFALARASRALGGCMLRGGQLPGISGRMDIARARTRTRRDAAHAATCFARCFH